MESAAASKNIHEAHRSQRAAESLCFVAAIVGAVWLGLGIKTAGNHDTFYVFFFPVIWIAVGRGLRGAATGILLLDIGIVLSLEFSGVGFGSFLGSPITHVSTVADRANTGHADQRAQSHGETVIPRRRAHAAIA